MRVLSAYHVKSTCTTLVLLAPAVTTVATKNISKKFYIHWSCSVQDAGVVV